MKKTKSEERAHIQINNPSLEKFFKIKSNEDSLLNYSPAQFDFNSGIREISVSEIDQTKNFANDSFNEYQYDHNPHFADPQAKIKVKYNRQLEGDHSVSISKETDEALVQSRSKKGSSDTSQNYKNPVSK